jgi:recombinational DNA repair protein RecT
MQPGYKGELKMARRSDSVAFIDAFDVRANDFIEIEFGDTPKVTHKIPKFGEPRGDVIGFYCVARDRRGNSHIEMMTNTETIEHYSRFTQAKNRGPFAELNTKGAKHPNFIPYGLKTVIHRICRRKLDLSREQAQQYAEDDRVNRMIVQPAAAGIIDAANGAILNLPIPEITEETASEQTSAEKTQALLADMKAKTEKDSVLPSKEVIAAGKGDKPAT